MFNYKSIVSDDELTMEFKISETKGIINALDRESGEKIGTVIIPEGSVTFEASSDDVFMQYKLWQIRPERKVGYIVQFEGLNIEQLAEEYDELLIGAYLLTHKCNIVHGKEPAFGPMIDWLRTTDFYTAPASTQYHDSVPGGLLVHSLKVYNKMLSLLKVSDFSKVDVAKATVAALVHDWCKIGYYESYTRNVKNEQTGQWEKVPSFKVNQTGIPMGHGATSMYLATRMMRLNIEQALAIRHHMGRWNCADVEQSELQTANAKYPMVYLIQFADQLACVDY